MYIARVGIFPTGGGLLTPPGILSLPVSGAFMGWISWHSGSPALFLPAAVVALAWAWGAAPGRWPAFLLLWGYFLAGAHDIPALAGTFFGDRWPAAGWGLWLLHAAILAAPFGILHSTRRRPCRFVFALLITAIPPLGILGWISPLLAAGAVLPGWGIAGLVVALVGLGVATLIGDLRRAWIKLAIVPAMVALPVVVDFLARDPVSDPLWFGQNTSMGRYPATGEGHIERQAELLGMANEAVRGGAKLVLFPEEIAGLWDASLEAVWLRAALEARERGATILVGATTEENGLRRNSLIGMGADDLRVGARIPMPVSMWRPWSSGGYAANVAGSGLINVQGKEVAVSVCYEDLLVWPLAVSFGTGNPVAILSAGNNWFGNASASRIQRESIELQARLYGVPLIRAVNHADLST